MGITQLNFEGKNKVEVAIDLLQAFKSTSPYYGADSGGKDSTVIVDLALVADVPVDWHYCVSPIDPPEVHQFLKAKRPETRWDYHARGWWALVVKNGLPRRNARWCCRYIKEAGGHGRTIIVGNRREEGRGGRRRHQNCFEQVGDKVFVRPIIDWSTAEVWEYIKANNLAYCSLYDEGFHRIGCVLCPFNRNVKREIERFPKIARLWRRASDRIVEKELAKGKNRFQTGGELFDWWISRQ